MELDEKQIELVGLYLQRRLKGEELSDFLKEVERNPLLKEELNIQQAIYDGIEHRTNQALRESFKKLAAENKESAPKKTVISLPYIKLISSVAAVAVLCFAAYFLLNTPSDTQTLYSSYYEPSELNITRSTDLEEDLVTVNELYNTKKYDKALPLFKKIIDANPSSSKLRLAYGNTLMICNKMKKAREQFNYIIDAKDPLYSDQSRWYLSLLELKAGRVQQTMKGLSVLANDPNSDFHSEASALLEELKEMD